MCTVSKIGSKCWQIRQYLTGKPILTITGIRTDQCNSFTIFVLYILYCNNSQILFNIAATHTFLDKQAEGHEVRQ